MLSPHYTDPAVTLYAGDCVDVMRELPDNSVDAVVTDPPYGLGFMGREWDTYGGRVMSESTRTTQLASGAGWTAKPYSASGKPAAPAPGEMHAFQAWCQTWAAECLRVLKPGGHLLAFGGTRTHHRLACAIEDAGFEIRDSIAWLYGSGFPKSLNVGRAIEGQQLHGSSSPSAIRRVNMGDDYRPHRAAGREGFGDEGLFQRDSDDRNPPGGLTTDDARQWQGWGTALKPAHEPIVVARKPLAGTVAANVLAHGTGALNVDGCRVEGEPDRASGWSKSGSKAGPNTSMSGPNYEREPKPDNPAGRWPPNVVLDPTQAEELDRQSGTQRDGVAVRRNGVVPGMYSPAHPEGTPDAGYGGEGGASRFFPTFRYEAKAPTLERPRGDTLHPTVKPLDLMRWLVRLVTPPGGVVLEPFAGSGTTAEACVIEGFRCIAIERENDYLPLIVARLSKPIQPDLFGGA